MKKNDDRNENMGENKSVVVTYEIFLKNLKEALRESIFIFKKVLNPISNI
jgi:hypothetical protein